MGSQHQPPDEQLSTESLVSALRAHTHERLLSSLTATAASTARPQQPAHTHTQWRHRHLACGFSQVRSSLHPHCTHTVSLALSQSHAHYLYALTASNDVHALLAWTDGVHSP